MSIVWKKTPDDEKKAEVVRLDLLGMKSEEIAAHLEISKNALVGWCWRNQVTISDRVLPRNRVPKEVFVPEIDVDPKAWSALPASSPVTLEFLGESQCHWPVGDFDGSAQLFCGCASGSRRYCTEHRKMSLVGNSGDSL